jgi:hypothetical protein
MHPELLMYERQRYLEPGSVPRYRITGHTLSPTIEALRKRKCASAVSIHFVQSIHSIHSITQFPQFAVRPRNDIASKCTSDTPSYCVLQQQSFFGRSSLGWPKLSLHSINFLRSPRFQPITDSDGQKSVEATRIHTIMAIPYSALKIQSLSA